MPAILICTKPDGRILVSAMPEAPEGYEQDAVEAASLDEAADMVKDVLGAEQTGAGEQEGGEAPQEAPEGAEGMPTDDRDQQMAAGYFRANKGY